MISKKRLDAIVIGGGVAGLVAAVKLVGLGREVILLEKETALGGRLRPLSWEGIDIDRGYYISHHLLPEVLQEIGALPLRRHPLTSHSVYDISEPNSHENMHHRLERMHPLAVAAEEALRAIPEAQLDGLVNVTMDEWVAHAVDGNSEATLAALAADLLTRGGIVDPEAMRTVSVARFARLLRAGGPSEGRTGMGRWLPVGVESSFDTWGKRSAKLPAIAAAISAQIIAGGGTIRLSATATQVGRSENGFTVEYSYAGATETLSCEQLYIDVPPYQAVDFVDHDILAPAFGDLGGVAFSTFGMVGSYISLGLLEKNPGSTTESRSEVAVTRLIDSTGPEFLGTYMVGEKLGLERTAVFADSPEGSSPVLSMRMLPLSWILDDARKSDVEYAVKRHLDAIRQSAAELGGHYEFVAEWMATEKTAPLHLLQAGTAPRGDALAEFGLALIGDGYDWTFHRPWGMDASLQSGRDAVDLLNSQ